MKVFAMLIFALTVAACSADDRSVGNGPGDADGAGRDSDAPTNNAAAETVVVPQDPGQATRERPSADARSSPESGNPAPPRTADQDVSSDQSSEDQSSTK